jgi:hypothetical protein
MDFDGRILAVETFDAVSAAHAMRTALVLLYADPAHGSVELWVHGKLLARYKRPLH